MSISLSKGSKLSLTKSDGGNLTTVGLGLGWDPKRGRFGGKVSVDLDASAILFDSSKRAVDTVFFGSLRSKDGSVVHSGDNLTGDGDGDDELITVDLVRVPANVESIVFVITSYSNDTFDKLENVYARVLDVSAGNTEVTRYNLAERGSNTASVIARVFREGAGWAIQALGVAANGRTASKIVADAAAVA